MKIIRLSTFLDFGGIESKMVNLATYQDSQNEWVFVAIGKGGDAERKIISKGKRAIALQLNHRIPSFSTLWKLFLFLRKEKPDILHTSGAEAIFFGFIAGKLAGISTIVVEEIGIPTHSPKAKKIFQYIFKHADWAIGESQLVVNHIRNTFGLNPLKTKVVHNFGIFSYDFSKLKRTIIKDVFRIIMISRLEPVKNIEGVFNVLSKLIKDQAQIKLTIAGSGSLEKELNQKIIELGLQNHVDFVGFITNPYPYLVNSDLYILNSFSEGFSNSLVEAMYSKTPSLSTAVGSAPEMIKDGVNGFIVAVDDEEVLYKKLKAISTMSQTEREEIALKGHQTVVENFSLEKHISSLMDIYKA